MWQNNSHIWPSSMCKGWYQKALGECTWKSLLWCLFYLIMLTFCVRGLKQPQCFYLFEWNVFEFFNYSESLLVRFYAVVICIRIFWVYTIIIKTPVLVYLGYFDTLKKYASPIYAYMLVPSISDSTFLHYLSMIQMISTTHLYIWFII